MYTPKLSRCKEIWEMKDTVGFIGMWVFGFLAVTLFHQSVLAEEIRVYTLDGCVKEALANNWKLKAKKEQLDQTEYVKNQARAEFLPKLSTTYGYKRYAFVMKNVRKIYVFFQLMKSMQVPELKGLIPDPAWNKPPQFWRVARALSKV